MIREAKTRQIRSILQQSTEDFLSIDHTLAKLCIEGKITQEAGLKFSDNPDFYNELIRRGTVK
jgi:twitching motility protein PilT